MRRILLLLAFAVIALSSVSVAANATNLPVPAEKSADCTVAQPEVSVEALAAQMSLAPPAPRLLITCDSIFYPAVCDTAEEKECFCNCRLSGGTPSYIVCIGECCS